MENKGHSRTKKSQKQYSDTKIRVSGSRAAALKPLLKSIPGLSLLSEGAPESAAYEIECDENHLRLINNHAPLNQSPPKLSYSLTNAASLANLLREELFISCCDDLSATRKFLSKFERRYKKDGGAPGNISELKKLLEVVSGLGDLPRHFLDIPYFGHFQICQIMILEKGMPSSLSLIYDRSFGLLSERLATQKFNQLMAQVKKSKSKIFTSNSKSPELHVIGSYLAKEFESLSHSVLLIVSRNDFLPTTEEERAHFDEISNSLFLVLDNILFSDRFIQKESQMLSALEAHPTPLAVYDENNELAFENKAAQALEVKDFTRAGVYKIKKKSLYLFHRPAEEMGRDFLHLERINLLGELLNTLKHEVSNPLFGIELGAQVLSEDIPDEKETFGEISASVSRCRDIIDNFHSLYQSPNKRTQIDLVKLVQEMFVLTKSETRQIHKRLLIDGEDIKSTEFETVLIKTHSTWLGQIIFNLIINASQSLKAFLEERRERLIEIQIERLPASVRISISDNGPGISSEKLPFIFKPFYTTKDQGTGLGLAICTNLVKKLSGKIEANSNQTLPWTTFSLEFPYE